MQHGSRIMRLALSSMFTKILKVRPLMNYTVRDLIWGYEDPLIKLAKDIMPPGESPDLEKFGYFITVWDSSFFLWRMNSAMESRKFVTFYFPMQICPKHP